VTEFAPVETAIMDWLNASLGPAGSGAWPGGAHLRRIDSPETGGWAVIGLTDSGDADPLMRAQITALVLAGSWQFANSAAAAYAELLHQQQGRPVALAGMTLYVVDNIVGPARAKDPNGDMTAFSVTADYYLMPA
jgi:hypothetical protein